MGVAGGPSCGLLGEVKMKKEKEKEGKERKKWKKWGKKEKKEKKRKKRKKRRGRREERSMTVTPKSEKLKDIRPSFYTAGNNDVTD